MKESLGGDGPKVWYVSKGKDMTVSDVSHFSIYKNAVRTLQQRREVKLIEPFLIALSDFLPISDMAHLEPDPPDFVLTTNGQRVGIELTELSRAVFLKVNGGDLQKGEYFNWDKDGRTKARGIAEKYAWSKTTLDEVLAAFQYRLQDKIGKLSRCRRLFDELWLVFEIAKGNPLGLAVSKPQVITGKELLLDITAKFLYEIAALSKQAQPFTYIILFCGASFIAFPQGENRYRLPEIDPLLLDRGKKCPDSILTMTLGSNTVVKIT